MEKTLIKDTTIYSQLLDSTRFDYSSKEKDLFAIYESLKDNRE